MPAGWERLGAMFRALVLSVLALLSARTSCHAEGLKSPRCYPDWSVAAAIVRKERLVAIAELHEILRNRFAGELVKARLCEKDGRFVYRVIVRQRNGVIRNLTVDARRPFER